MTAGSRGENQVPVVLGFAEHHAVPTRARSSDSGSRARPELWAMVGMTQVGHLVHDHVVERPEGSADQLVGEADGAIARRARTPSPPRRWTGSGTRTNGFGERTCGTLNQVALIAHLA